MRIVIAILFLLCSELLLAQDSSTNRGNFSLNGYIKAVENLLLDPVSHSNSSGHLLHNRINTKYMPTDNLSFVGELRNRFFYGELGSENQKPVFKSEVERLYADFQSEKWNLRMGRQRVNWGIGTIWNPNDIFNAYNFLDLDYEERPGSDAVQIQYSINDFSHVEFVQNGIGNNQISAAKYFINKNGYDVQLIAGNYKGAATMGVGWAGNIKDAGFKGEAQYYYNNQNSVNQLNLTSSIDYIFKNNWYVNAGFLYNSNGWEHPLQQGQLLNLQLSAKNLMPTKYNVLLSTQKEINPLTAVSLTTVYAPYVDLIILMPSIKYNIATNLDVDFVCQAFFLQRQGQIRNTSELGFFRLRWSFGLKN